MFGSSYEYRIDLGFIYAYDLFILDYWYTIECARNNHDKMENQDNTFVLIENAKVRSNEEILTSLLSILCCEPNVNECFRLI